MTGNQMIALGAVLGALGVAIGAFGAHGLAARVTPDQLAIFETGVRYHFYHALALVLVGLLAVQRASAAPGATSAAAWLFVAGIVLFSGSLYVLVLSGRRWLGAVTPIGGVSFIAGWIVFARAALAAR